MSGDITKTNLWADADVYISTNLAATLPADASTPFGIDWTLVGLLDGGDGFEESREEEKKDHYAWGGILAKVSRKNFKLTEKFSVLEDNAATRSLIWPGSTETEIIKPVPVPIKIAFETREGDKVKRRISRNYAEVDVDGNLKEGEEDLTKATLVATIFPDASAPPVYFDVQRTSASLVSLAITPLTLALSLGGANVKHLVATATYSDATTVVVTDPAVWISGTPAKATVDEGYVTGVATGTSSISATFGGVTSTAPCVATVSA